MVQAAEILKAVHDVFSNGTLAVTVDARNLGMAYAVPSGLEATVVEQFSPWQRAEVKQVFFRQSALLAPMAEVQLVMSWRFSQAQQYIVDAMLETNVITLDPTVSLNIRVRFSNPSLFDTVLEAFEIPFTVEIKFDPILGTEIANFHGVIRADGSGVFNAF